MHDLDADTRKRLWNCVLSAVNEHFDKDTVRRVTPGSDFEEIVARLTDESFERGWDVEHAVGIVVECLVKGNVQPNHPRFLGYFTPAPTLPSLAGDLLSAAYNSQLATTDTAPCGVAVERRLLHWLAGRMEYPVADCPGLFTSGASESNHLALIAALSRRFESFSQEGLPQGARPVIYASMEAHHSIEKAARACGIGSRSVVRIPTASDFGMDVSSLHARLRNDTDEGKSPVLVVGTVGTTVSGGIDSISALAAVAAESNSWLHVDAAWAGAICMVRDLRYLIEGFKEADSVAVDPHKWLAVPMNTGVFLTKDPQRLCDVFGVGPHYLTSGRDRSGVDPEAMSLQCSRRFVGLRLLLPLLMFGAERIGQELTRQVRLGDFFRRLLKDSGWCLVNRSGPLPIVCFTDYWQQPGLSLSGQVDRLHKLLKQVHDAGTAQLNVAVVKDTAVIRGCICNFRTTEADIRVVVESLLAARSVISRM